MNSQRIGAIVTIVGLSFSTAVSAAERESRLEQEQRLDRAQRASPMMPLASAAQKRPAALPALYASLGLMQAWDIYSTSAALHAGAKESNPAAAPFTGHAGSMIGLKAASTASTIFFAERLWKTNKVGAVVVMAAINSALAVVSIHNMRIAQLDRAR
jgi:hypothetical protein